LPQAATGFFQCQALGLGLELPETFCRIELIEVHISPQEVESFINHEHFPDSLTIKRLGPHHEATDCCPGILDNLNHL
jgi:hypothetical protein